MKACNLFKTALLAALGQLCLTASAVAATYTVNSIADTGTGGCDVAECTLREAINAANANADNDIVNFDPAVFSTPQTITLTQGQLSIANRGSLSIDGPGAAVLTVSGNNASRVFSVGSLATVTISALTVTAARATGNGGGILAGNSSSLTLVGLHITGNYGDSGGGVLASPGSVVNLTGSTVGNNNTFRLGGSLGGGLFNNQGTVNIDSSIFTGNNAFYGGGIYNGGGMMTVSNSTVSGNTANDGGGVANGALFVASSSTNGVLTLNNTTISLNVATIRGGGYANFARNTSTLNNSTVSANTAISGGGVWNSGSATLNSLTISGNSAAITSGGGIRHFDGTTYLNSTIVANSVAGGDCAVASGGAFDVAHSLIGDGLACVRGMNLNNRAGNPNLGPLQNNGGPTQTHALLPGSIAIDAGNSVLTTDQRGLPRFDSGLYANATGGNGADIGAFEYQGLTPTIKDQCKYNGYMYFDNPVFINQGQCIQFVNTGK